MNQRIPRRIHVTGGAGSGKTTLARRLGELLDVPVLGLDGQGLDFVREMGRTIDFDTLASLRQTDAQRFVAENDAWVTEGACVLPYRLLFERADVVVWLDIPWPVASYRILMRHLKATIARNNRFPGWLRLYRFWCWSRRFYSDRNPPGYNEWGTPSTLATFSEDLRAYQHKLAVCRTRADVDQILRRFVTSPSISELDGSADRAEQSGQETRRPDD